MANITNLSSSPAVTYTLLEEGKDASKRSFQKYRAILTNTDQPVTVQRWAEWLSQASSFNDPVLAGLVQTIRMAPFAAVFFETPPVVSTTAASSQPLEFVLVDAPDLHAAASQNADPHAFASHFVAANNNNNNNNHPFTVAFDNLGGDARLIAPKPPPSKSKNNNNNKNNEKTATTLNMYAHLSSFCREAPEETIAAVWRLAAQEYLERIRRNNAHDASSSSSAPPVWFSTSGLGVYWLHFRLDAVPKYYTYLPYKQPASS